MPAHDLGARTREKIEQKMHDAVRRLEELSKDEALQVDREEVGRELQQVEAELAALTGEETGAASGARERLEARRERLLARLERLELKSELLRERRDRLTESLEEMRQRLTESLADLGPRVSSAVSAAVGGLTSEAQTSSGQSRRMVDERRKILEMVEKGTISAQQAGQLLDALRDQEETERRSRRKPRWVRIRVTDPHDMVRVNLTLPVGLVRAGLRAGGSIAGVEGLDTAGLEDMLDRGELGHLLDIRDSDKGERVEIFVE